MNGWKVFSEVADFPSWKARLRILALDLQDLGAITTFLEHVQVITAVCQEARRPI